MKTFLILIVMIFSSIGFVEDVPNIDIDNWLNHPEIVEIREIYSEVQRKRDNEQLIAKFHGFQLCTDQIIDAEILYLEADIPRMYYYDSRSEDSLVSYSFYYNAVGKLRFAFIQAGAINGTALEHRIYFDDYKRIWEIQKPVEGPGYTFFEIWPEEFIVYDPIAAFDSDCRQSTK